MTHGKPLTEKELAQRRKYGFAGRSKEEIRAAAIKGGSRPKSPETISKIKASWARRVVNAKNN